MTRHVSRLHLGDGRGHQFVHLAARTSGAVTATPLAVKSLSDLVLDVLVAGFLEIGRDHFLGIGGGGIARDRPSFSAAQRPSSLLRRASALNFCSSSRAILLLKTFLALVESGHSSVPIPANGKQGRVVAARSPT